ncbi:putative conjugal transfer protein TraB (plasmid) [Aureimonas sp. SA4125]|nr:putative conjugal transfer protein TraB [Aureimonas sp. SA4125]
MAYFLAASRGLPQGVANFYGTQFGLGLALWLAASLTFVAVHTALWTKRPGCGRPHRYALAAILMSVPPFGIVGWAHPITAAGMVFPGSGWGGLAATAILMLVMTTRRWPVAAMIIAGLAVWSDVNWTKSDAPNGWIGLDTHLGNTAADTAGYARQVETIRLAKAAATGNASVVVLPESAAGLWTSTVENLWKEAFAGNELTVIAGAAIVDPAGYDNVMLTITASRADILYRERMPVPVSMWQPWRRWMGKAGGARAHVFANPIASIGRRRVAPLICYEQLLVWPFLQSMLHAPDVIVATGNGWWTSGTSIAEIQRANTQAFARLFDLPLVMAFNR